MSAPTREAVLTGLQEMSATLQNVFKNLNISGGEICDAILAAAITYLKTDPAEALAEDYADRLEAVAETWDTESLLWEGTQSIALRGRAAGLREAAYMLRDKESR